MEIWLLVMVLVGSDGSVNATVNHALKYQVNNEEACNNAGLQLGKQAQEKFKDKGKIYWLCQPVDYNELQKALPPKI